ncbi:uncharacterized protein F4822DRAFT_351162 [Hypoxylon trugodes]|uniref:uncharacterized protein n=1 Tax=Hypoxylon trugodes TaxID=326681 RepID=UPI00219C149D|nr:uncharacterized protein F4822DRAFT_351162 [Hypoxylon trugodes]KAI1385677.1 hypothetical protein F4822DRAFT_351162 [Hypoxylon trugodes]
MRKRWFAGDRVNSIVVLCGSFQPHPPTGLGINCPVHTGVIVEKLSRVKDSNYINNTNNIWPWRISPELQELEGNFVVVNDKDETVGFVFVEDVSWFHEKAYGYLPLAAAFMLQELRFSTDIYEKYMYCGLLLVAHKSKPNSYYRVGFIYVGSQTYFRQATKQEIVLL